MADGRGGHQRGDQLGGYCEDLDERLWRVDRGDEYWNSEYILNVTLSRFADG